VKAIEANGVEAAQAAKHVLDNAETSAEARYRGLSSLYDENTIRRIEQRGIDRGGLCLEVGGGEDRSLPGSMPESALLDGCSLQILVHGSFKPFLTRIWKCVATIFGTRTSPRTNLISHMFGWC